MATWTIIPNRWIVALFTCGSLCIVVAAGYPVYEFESAEVWALGSLGAGLALWGSALVLAALGYLQYLWLGETRFGCRSHWPFRTREIQGHISEFAGITQDTSRAVLRLQNGDRFEIPRGLWFHLEDFGKVLDVRRTRLLAGVDTVVTQPAAHWPPAFTFEQSGGGNSSRETGEPLEIDDPHVLRSLVHRYRAAAIFRESFPPAFDLVKIFMGLKRSNGGLVLIGVHPGGEVVGLPEDELADAQERLEHLARELTSARVEIGRMELKGKIVLFAVFNATRSNTGPLDLLQEATSEVVVV